MLIATHFQSVEDSLEGPIKSVDQMCQIVKGDHSKLG